jgi:hypothetical protein
VNESVDILRSASTLDNASTLQERQHGQPRVAVL